MTTTLFRFPFAALRGLLFGLLLGLPALPAWAVFNAAGAFVHDTDTGLTWDRCPLGWTWNNSTLVCESSGTDTFIWQQALDMVVTANASNHLGHNDWRLPNIKELESLVDISTFDPAIDTFFGMPSGTAFYWSSTTWASNPSYAWLVNFNNGGTNASYKTNTYSRVRLVRGGQSFDLLMPPPPPPANVTSIPTLGEWATLLLAGLGMAAGWMALRRPRRS